jgi:hypothetical protein
MFLNFTLDHNIQPYYVGVDIRTVWWPIKLLNSSKGGPGIKRSWGWWEHLFMGLRTSPSLAIQYMYLPCFGVCEWGSLVCWELSALGQPSVKFAWGSSLWPIFAYHRGPNYPGPAASILISLWYTKFALAPQTKPTLPPTTSRKTFCIWNTKTTDAHQSISRKISLPY